MENICWGEKCLPAELQCYDLKDPKWYYKTLVCVKNSSDKDIPSANQKVSSEFRELARTHHPDKTGGDEKIIEVFKLK